MRIDFVSSTNTSWCGAVAVPGTDEVLVTRLVRRSNPNLGDEASCESSQADRRRQEPGNVERGIWLCEARLLENG